MRKQDHLLELIASLNANEKRHFRLFAGQQQADTNYLKLFDALEQEQLYNAARLRTKLKLTAAQLEKQKSYLAKVLLKSLRIYKDGVSFNATMSNYLLEIEELMGRRLYDYALELIDKALAHAELKDQQYLVPAILYCKLDVLILTGKFDALNEIAERTTLVQQKNAAQQSVHLMLARVQQFGKSGKHPKHFAYHQHPLLKTSPEKIQSKRALIGWFAMMNAYHHAVLKNDKQTVLFARKQAAIYESDASLSALSAQQHLYVYQFLATAEIAAGYNEKALAAIDKLMLLITSYSKRLKPATLEHATAYGMLMRANAMFYMGNYAGSLAIAKTLETNRHLPDESTRFTILFVQAKAMLHTGASTNALEKLDTLLKINQQLREDLQPYLRPMLILAHLQLGNYRVVPPLIRTTRAWMKRQKVTNAEVNLLLSHAYAIAKAPVLKRKEDWKKLGNAGLGTIEKELHLNKWIKPFAR
jgi:hypothetical protein